MSLQRFKQSLQTAPIIKKGDYSYLVHPITDGIPMIDPHMLQEIISEMKKHVTTWGFLDRILTIETMGIPLATLLSIEMNIPFTIIRKRSYGFAGERMITQQTGYSQSQLSINGVKKGENVVIVDDLISTGGTIQAVLAGLQKIGVHVKGIIVAINKGDAVKQLQNQYNVPITSLVDVKIQQNGVSIINNR